MQSSSRKESGDYASRLAQMRSARRAGGPGSQPSQARPEQEAVRGGRMQMLRKQLDESKAE